MEQIKIVGSFESYASGIGLSDLRKIAKLLGTESPSRYGKIAIIAKIRDALTCGTIRLKMFARNSIRQYGWFSYLMRVLKHFEDLLNMPHTVSEGLERLWACYLQEISARGELCPKKTNHY